jgi:hypothetical protein
MVGVPLLSGVTSDQSAEFKTSYPLNLEPVVIDSKISKGQLRATAGAVQIGSGPGVDRGGINWKDQLYRVMGTRLVRVSAAGAVTDLGDVGSGGPVNMDYSTDYLAINSGTRMYLFNGTTLTQVSDEDLGQVIDLIWIDGYFMFTDGTYVGVTELSNPFEVKPLKYGSAEEDPDPVTGLQKLRGEAYVPGRYTTQVFRNVGGNGFPFQTLTGATIPYGCVSPSAKCLFADTFAFVGSARDEALGVYLAGQGTASKVSTRVVDDALAGVSDPTSIIVENRSSRDERRLFVHLPDETWVFLANASQAVKEPVWYRCQSGNRGPYRIRNAVPCYGKLIAGDLSSGAVAEVTDTSSAHFGEKTEWQFDAGLIYNEGRGAILHSVELIGLPGRGPHGEQPTAFLSMTRDGETFSQERAIPIGNAGDRTKRMQWRPNSRFRNYLGLRFRGYNHAMPGFAKCEANLTPLNV